MNKNISNHRKAQETNIKLPEKRLMRNTLNNLQHHPNTIWSPSPGIFPGVSPGVSHLGLRRSEVKESVAADEAVAAEAAAKSEAQKAEVEADLEEAQKAEHGSIGPWDEMKPTLRLCQNSY